MIDVNLWVQSEIQGNSVLGILRCYAGVFDECKKVRHCVMSPSIFLGQVFLVDLNYATFVTVSRIAKKQSGRVIMISDINEECYSPELLSKEQDRGSFPVHGCNLGLKRREKLFKRTSDMLHQWDAKRSACDT